MPVDIKAISDEIKAGIDSASTQIASLKADNAQKDATIASLQATVGNVPDEVAATIRQSLEDLKTSLAPAPPTN